VAYSYSLIKFQKSAQPLKLSHGFLGAADEIAVFLPLQSWNRDTGIFIDDALEPGDGLSIKGDTLIVSPAHGDVCCIFICLKLESVEP
jgi:hypothetical protein